MTLKEYTPTSVRPTMSIGETLKTASVVLALLAVLAVHSDILLAVVIGLGAWSMRGSKQALQALSLLVLVKSLNSGIYDGAGSITAIAWASFVLAGLRIIYDCLRFNSLGHPVIKWLWLFALAVIIQSMLVSQYGVVSVFKIIAFTYMATVLLLGFKLTVNQGVNWAPWFLGLWLAIALVSIPMLAIPEIGYRTNGHGFQGILKQPQMFGVFMAPAVAWLTGTLLFMPNTRAHWLYWLYWLLVPIAFSLMFLSSARTAMVALFAGLLIVFVVALLNRPEWRQRIGKALVKPLNLVVAFGIIVVLVAQWSLVLETAQRFILKWDEPTSIESSFEGSRGFLIQDHLRDFKEHPVLGIGFGVSLDPTFEPKYDSFMGLPISAQVEKGFLPTAILQETGIFGTVFFAVFLLSLLRQVLSNPGIVLPWVFVTCLFVNIGELILFSPNGFGLYIWLLMAWAASWRWERKLAP